MFEAEVVLVFRHALAGVVIDEREDTQDDSDLGDADAGVAESVNDVPGVAEPGNLGKDEAAN